MSDQPKTERKQPWLPDLKTVKRADIDHDSNRLMDLLMLGGEYLARQGVEDSRLDAELLLASRLGIQRLDLFLQFDRPLTQEEKADFRILLVRRAGGEPVQYILGRAAFRELELKVRPGALIPRPETERLVEAALKFAPEQGWRSAFEVGVGSGAIALSLLEEGIVPSVTAVDVAEEAVTLTGENAEELGYLLAEGEGTLESPFRLTKESKRELILFHADALVDSFTPPGTPFPLVISNPPYVTEGEYDLLPTHILKHEPKTALVSGEDGLNAHRALATQLPSWLEKGGLFLGEIGKAQGKAAKELHSGWASSVDIHLDLAGLDRIVAARY